jgi:hypothetical protein
MFKNFVGLKIMITDFIKKHKTAFIRIFNLFYFTLLIILGIVCSALMLFGTIKHIVLYLQISAFGFCMLFSDTAIYQIINGTGKKRLLSIVFILLAIATLTLAFLM